MAALPNGAVSTSPAAGLPAAGQVGRAKLAAFRVVQNGAVLKPRQHRGRQQLQALVVNLRLQISDQRHLAGVVSVLPHHRLERSVHWFHIDKIQLQ